MSLVLKADMNDAAQVRGRYRRHVRAIRPDRSASSTAPRASTPAAFGSAAETGPEVMDAQFSPKLRGLLHLVDAFRGREPRRWVLHWVDLATSSAASGWPPMQRANAVLDAVAEAGGSSWLSVDWDLWDNAAEATAVGMPVAIHPPKGSRRFSAC